MKSRIIRIGSSRGIRIPKLLLEQTGLRGHVEIIALGDTLLMTVSTHETQFTGRRCLPGSGGFDR
jgi:antitoxin MazE